MVVKLAKLDSMKLKKQKNYFFAINKDLKPNIVRVPFFYFQQTHVV